MRPHAPHASTQWAKEMPGATLRPKVLYNSTTGSRSNTAPFHAMGGRSRLFLCYMFLQCPLWPILGPLVSFSPAGSVLYYHS